MHRNEQNGKDFVTDCHGSRPSLKFGSRPTSHLDKVRRLLSWWSSVPVKGNDSQLWLLILEEMQNIFLSEPDATIDAHHGQTA